jgi:hypothetical protein
MNAVSTVGIDLAKNVFSVHAVDPQGAVVVRRTFSRAKLGELIAQLLPCLIGTGVFIFRTPLRSSRVFLVVNGKVHPPDDGPCAHTYIDSARNR